MDRPFAEPGLTVETSNLDTCLDECHRTAKIAKGPSFSWTSTGCISVFGFPHDGPPPGAIHTSTALPTASATAAASYFRASASITSSSGRPGGRTARTSTCPGSSASTAPWPTLSFDEQPDLGHGALEAGARSTRYAAGRPAAWIDDSLNEECFAWAEGASEPTLLVHTDPAVGITPEHVDLLVDWAQRQAGTLAADGHDQDGS